MVVTNTAEAMAGSALNLSSSTGVRIPAVPATTRLVIMASAITTPSCRLSKRSQVTTPISTAKIAPLANPTTISRPISRRSRRPSSSRMASARTVTVMVWVPALPPIEATIGMRMASATI